MSLLFEDRFWFFHLLFGSIVKDTIFWTIPNGKHFLPSRAFLSKFTAFAYFVINRLIFSLFLLLLFSLL